MSFGSRWRCRWSCRASGLNKGESTTALHVVKDAFCCCGPAPLRVSCDAHVRRQCAALPHRFSLVAWSAPSFLLATFTSTVEPALLAHSALRSATAWGGLCEGRWLAWQTESQEVKAMIGNLTTRDQALLERIAWHREQQRVKDEERAERARRHWHAAVKARGGDNDVRD